MFEKIKWYIKDHSNEMIVLGVMTGVLLTIGLAVTGDVSEALARGARR